VLAKRSSRQEARHVRKRIREQALTEEEKSERNEPFKLQICFGLCGGELGGGMSSSWLSDITGRAEDLLNKIDQEGRCALDRGCMGGGGGTSNIYLSGLGTAYTCDFAYNLPYDFVYDLLHKVARYYIFN
jgi:hypothetical protein